MSIWGWIDEFSARALMERNTDKIRLANLCWEAVPLTTKEPARALDLLGQGEALAEQIGERRWVLFFRHWQVQTLIFRTRRHTQALRIAETAASEARRPEFDGFPQRVCLHDDLISIYLGRDPLGHAEAISSAFEFMQAEVVPDSECVFCLRALRVDHAVALGDWDRASEEARRLMNAAHRHRHYAVYGYSLLCRIAYGQGDRRALHRWAWMADETASASGDEGGAAEIWMWQALASRWAGREPEAFSCYRKARSATRRLRAIPPSGYYDAFAEYHQTIGSHRRALLARRRELATLDGQGQTFEEVQCRLKVIRLLTALRRPTAEEKEQAAALAQSLADPQPFLAELASD